MKAERATGSRSTLRGPRNRFQVTAGGVLMRIVGITVWRLARADSLPVPPLRREEASSIPSLAGSRLMLARLLRAASFASLIAAVCALVIGALAFERLRAIRMELLENPDGDTLLQQADRLETSLDDVWWLRFYPGYPHRVARMARELREGRSALLDAAVMYGDCLETLASLGLPARLVQGTKIVAPLAGALEKVPTQFHRETVTFLQIEAEIRPYLRPEQDRAALSGILSSCPSGHALGIAGIDRDGVTSWKTAGPVLSGKEFKINLEPVAAVRLTDLYKPPGTAGWQVVESVDVPFEKWTDGPIPFSAVGPRFEIQFAREKHAQAPPFPKLSAYARAVIAPWPSSLRGG